MLQIDRLALSVAARTLLREVSLSIEPGELWCIVGANGAGKTLFLHTLIGLRAIEHGEIRLRGRAVDQWSLAEAARVRGFLPQSTYHAFPMRVLDAVVMGRYPYLSRWRWEQDEDRLRAVDALAAVGLPELAHRDIMTLSGGERQRVCIAALLAQDAPLLLLDEPVSHLDLRHQIIVLQHLRQLADAGRAVMLSIHDLNLAHRFATHVMLFRGGGACIAGPVDEVMNEAALSDAFGCRVTRITAAERTLFLAA
ncbi:MAG: ABC transporter ATP-binding protein [Pseudomonadota bacterium]|nr:ABC transporter ATP-binding protein [Pseudomonadota bacterium]